MYYINYNNKLINIKKPIENKIIVIYNEILLTEFSNYKCKIVYK